MFVAKMGGKITATCLLIIWSIFTASGVQEEYFLKNASGVLLKKTQRELWPKSPKKT